MQDLKTTFCLNYLFKVIGDEEEVNELGIGAELAHNCHHIDALPQRAGGLRACLGTQLQVYASQKTQVNMDAHTDNEAQNLRAASQ